MVYRPEYDTIIDTVTLTVTTTGADGDASGTADSGPLYGYLLDVFLDYDETAPTTTDVLLLYLAPANGQILAVANSATDTFLAPRQTLVDNAGAAITNSADRYALNGTVQFQVAGCNALAAAVTARLRYVRIA